MTIEVSKLAEDLHNHLQNDLRRENESVDSDI